MTEYKYLDLEPHIREMFPFYEVIIQGNYSLVKAEQTDHETELILKGSKPFSVYFPELWRLDSEEDLRILIDFGGYWQYNLITLYESEYHLDRPTDGKEGALIFATDMGQKLGIEIQEFRKLLREVKDKLADLGIKFKTP